MALKDQTLSDLVSQIAAGTVAPGGGASAAVTGALGAALVGMVAGLTVGRQKYTSVHEEMIALQAKSREEAEALLTCANADERAFTQVMAAYALPKATDEEQAARGEALRRGYKAATEVPLQIMSHAISVMRMTLAVMLRGNPNAQADGYVGYLQAQTAFDSGLYMVATNFTHLAEDDRQDVKERVRRLRRERSEIERAVNASLPDSMHGVLAELD